jgi:hypothetical protein
MKTASPRSHPSHTHTQPITSLTSLTHITRSCSRGLDAALVVGTSVAVIGGGPQHHPAPLPPRKRCAVNRPGSYRPLQTGGRPNWSTSSPKNICSLVLPASPCSSLACHISSRPLLVVVARQGKARQGQPGLEQQSPTCHAAFQIPECNCGHTYIRTT